MMVANSKHQPVQSLIREWLASDAPARPFSPATLAERIGAKHDSVANCLVRMAERGEVTEMVARKLYQARGAGKVTVPDGTMFEAVGRSASGRTIVRDEAGVLWVIEKL